MRQALEAARDASVVRRPDLREAVGLLIDRLIQQTYPAELPPDDQDGSR